MKMRRTPQGWRTGTVADICQMQNGHGFGPEDWDTHGLPIIRIQNLNGGKTFDYYSGKPEPRWLVAPGQLLFAWAGTRGVSFGPTVWRGPLAVLNQHIFKLEPKPDIDRTWLNWALRYVTNRIEGQAHGFKATLVHVKKSDINRQPVSIPPLPEQQQIASALSTWDEAIHTAEQLLANSRKQKRALMQRLLGSRSASMNWRSVQIRQIADRVTRDAESNASAYPVLMISSSSGFIRQDEQYGRYMAGKSVEKYVLLHKGEFGYNKGNSKRYEFGCVFPLESCEQGLVPHVYVCFALRRECDPTFYKYLFEADYLHDQLGALVNTGVRNNGLLNIRPADFMGVKVPLPPLEDQRRIAAIARVASDVVASNERDLAALVTEKQALVQQLFTGKRRLRQSKSASEAAA